MSSVDRTDGDANSHSRSANAIVGRNRRHGSSARQLLEPDKKSFFGTMNIFGKRRSRVAADSAIARMAGRDSWKTWAGRRHGDDDMELLDIVRGVQRTLQKALFTGIPPAGTPCPVCFYEPDVPHEWHVTTSCSHAVCIDCFRGYAASQVRDRKQTGPLRCPVCPQELRKSDAKAALAHDSKLVELLDLKLRNQLLRALPSYRSCPHCSGTKPTDEALDTSSASSFDSGDPLSDHNATQPITGEKLSEGGGFVTSECLSEQYKDRRQKAQRRLNWLPHNGALHTVLYAALAMGIVQFPSSSQACDLCAIILSAFPVLRSFWTRRVGVAQAARRELARPISVGCPCCDKSFLLPPEAARGMLNDEETSRWINARTRPCPSCSAPIEKNGGCNHMKCGRCHANFCWACMRLRTSCAAYACKNGAPYRNAMPGGRNTSATAAADPLIVTIDSIITRGSGRFTIIDAVVLSSCLFGRSVPLIRWVLEFLISGVACLFGIGFFAVLAFGCVVMQLAIMVLYCVGWYYNRRQTAQNRGQQQHRRGHLGRNEETTASGRLVFDFLERNARQQNGTRRRNVQHRVTGMTERQMINEAIRRSMADF